MKSVTNKNHHKNLISQLPRRDMGTLLALIALTGCAPDTSFSKNPLEYRTSTKTSFAQISMDAFTQEISLALSQHISLAATQIPQLSLTSLDMQTIWGDYTSTTLLADFTEDPSRHFIRLGLPQHVPLRYQVLAALLGEQSQWNNAYTDTGLAPNQPSLLLNRGLFITKSLSIPQSLMVRWKRWFDQGYFQTDFQQVKAQAVINEWLTVNSGTPIIRQTLPPHPSLICWDIWLCASKWDLLLVQSRGSVFYSPNGINQSAEFFALQGNFRSAQMSDTVLYEVPLEDRLSFQIFLPHNLNTMTDAQKKHYAQQFPQWQQQAAQSLKMIPALKTTGMMIMDLPFWQIQSAAVTSTLLPADTLFPQFGPQAKLSSHTGQIALTISAGGIGPREYSTPREIAESATSLPRISVTVPFLYRIVDSSTGIIFFQGIMHNNYA